MAPTMIKLMEKQDEQGEKKTKKQTNKKKQYKNKNISID